MAFGRLSWGPAVLIAALVVTATVPANAGSAGAASLRGHFASAATLVSAGAAATARLSGSNRYLTSIAISQEAFPASLDGQGSVYLARGDVLADAVAAGTLMDGPILLVPACGVPPAYLVAEVERLDPGRVVALGSDGSVCEGMLSSLSGGRATARLAGPDRFATARAIADERLAQGPAAVAFVASGLDDAPEPVAGGQLSGGPILTVSPSGGASVTAAAAWVSSHPQVKTVIALGGPSTVSDSVLAAVAGSRSKSRLSGPNRYATAAAIAEYEFGGVAPSLYLARGDVFADAAAAGALADGPVLMTGSCTLDKAVTDAVALHRPMRVVALGSTFAVCDEILAQAAASVPTSTPSILSGRTLSEVSDNVGRIVSPRPARVALAANGDELSLAIAAANASAGGYAALMARSANASSVLDQLEAFDPDTVELVGSPDSFGPDLVTALQARYDVDQAHIASAPFDRGVAATDTTARNRIVVTDSTDVAEQSLAAQFAVATRTPLAVVDSQAVPATMATVFEDPNNTEIVVVGPVPASLGFEQVGQDLSPKVQWLDTSDIDKAQQAAIEAMISAGRDAPRVVASTDVGLGSAALAGLVAEAVDGVVSSTAALSSYSTTLYSPLSFVGAVGVSARSAAVSSLNAAQPTPQPAPTFRVTDVTVSGSSFTATTSAVAGATRYSAYDNTGSLAGTSTSRTITISGQPKELAILATSASGAALGEVQMRINDYSEPGRRDEIIVGSDSDGRNHLAFLGGTGVPRIITRLPVSMYSGTVVDVEADIETIAITCESNFTDLALDGANQYTYQATVLNNDRETCGHAPNAGPDLTRTTSGVVFPATEALAEPSLSGDTTKEPMTTSSEAVPEAPRARMSQLASVIRPEASSEDASASANDGGKAANESQSSGTGPGDGWPDVVFRYQAWIRKDKALAPEPSGLPTHPFVFYGGDGRSENPNGTYRFRQNVRVKFGSDHDQLYTEAMGETFKYACPLPTFWGCILRDRDTAPVSQLSRVDSFHAPTYGWFTLKADAKNPLGPPGSPAITAEMTVVYGPGRTVLLGLHDRMPSHEVWFYADGWGEWAHTYSSREKGLQCLAGWIPGCTTLVNVEL